MNRRDFVFQSFGAAGGLVPALALAQSLPCPPGTTNVVPGTSSTTTCTRASAPSWFLNMPERTWTKIATGAGSGYGAGQTLQQASYRPAPSGTAPAPNVESYSGGAVDQARKEFLVHGGGHGSYAGNEVYALTVASEIPSWGYLNAPSPGAYSGGGATSNGPGQYTADVGVNGAPQASHTYNRALFASNRFWLAGLGNMNSQPNGSSSYFYFDRATLQWVRVGKMISDAQFSGNYQITFMEQGCATYVQEDNTIWTTFDQILNSSAPALAVFDAATGANLKVYTQAQAVDWGKCMCIALPGKHLIIIGGSPWWDNGPGLWIFDPTSPTNPRKPVRANVSNSTGANPFSYNWGWHYHPGSNAILMGDGGENFFKMSVPADPKAGTWVVQQIAPANSTDANRVIPGSPTSYAYGRFNVIDDMGNGQGAIVWLEDMGSDKPTYVLKLPAGGI